MFKERAVVAGGCFWCTESSFLEVLGVESTRCGYTGGEMVNPTYEEVCTGTTGHYEALEILFDPDKVTYLQILDLFWRRIDPFDAGGQFADRGSQYRTAIFYQDARQEQLARESKEAVETLFQKPVKTQILAAKPFYPAEEVHQAYCVKRPVDYHNYASHHQLPLEKIWQGKKIPGELEDKLTPLQYKVTQQEGTEAPFHNAYWNTKEEGIYVDIVSGEPLFCSNDKFDSGTGWPSFMRPIHSAALEERSDHKLGVERIEVRCKRSQSHLGHLFPDGPAPTGLRYCMNSAALRFIPRKKMAEEGYASYLRLFL